jgi:hypothetical protein
MCHTTTSRRIQHSQLLPLLLTTSTAAADHVHHCTCKQEACWTISNITAGTKEQIQSVVEADILPPLVHLLGTAGAANPCKAGPQLAPRNLLRAHVYVDRLVMQQPAVNRRV